MASAYQNLIRELAVTDFKLKYQGSVLGYLWSFAKPLLLFMILYFVFTRFIRIGSRVPNYGLYLLLGIVMWTYFADTTSRAMSSIVERGDLIRKVYFPRIVIVVAASISSLITLVLNLVVVLLFILVLGVRPGWSALLFVLLVAEFFVFTLGCSLLLSSLFVRFRDLRHIWDVGLQLLFYATPIIYPLEVVPRKAAVVLALNPIAQILQDAREVLTTPSTLTVRATLGWPLAIVPYMLPPLLVVLGYWYFQRAASAFAEEI